jgi:hypothetical protein
LTAPLLTALIARAASEGFNENSRKEASAPETLKPSAGAGFSAFYSFFGGPKKESVQSESQSPRYTVEDLAGLEDEIKRLKAKVCYVFFAVGGFACSPDAMFINTLRAAINGYELECRSKSKTHVIYS